jgi:gliding motility-associatede transport system auxiliary component
MEPREHMNMSNKIFGIIGWLGTAFVLASIAIWLATRTRLNLPAQWDQYRYYLAWAGLVCVLIYMLSQWREIMQVFRHRQARYGTLAATSVLVVLGILIAINYIGKQQNKRWDLTANKQFSLSDQSRNVLAKLDAPMHIMVFAQETEFPSFQDRLKEYEYTSKQITTEYVDPDKKRTVAQANGVQQYGTIIVNYKGRTERTTTNTEQDITNTIIKAVSGQQRKVYFTQGHGEKDPTSSERDGYNTIAEALKQENYGAEKIVLAQTGSVPEDASVVVVAGPRTDFFQPEIDALKKYLGNAGKVLLMLDPPEKPDAAATPNLVALAHDWGIDVQNSIVVDVSGMGRILGTDASVPVAANYPSHAITERFAILTAYPLARAVVPVSGGVNGHTAQTIVDSSPRSWAESDLKGLLTSGEVALDPEKGDKPGPVSLAAAVSAPTTTEAPKPDANAEAPKPETRVVVFGDSDFASNGVLGIQGNRDLFMNTIGWLSQQENLISIRPKDAGDRRLTLTAAQQSNITWLSLLILPAAIFGTGVYSWWRRR